ncbi:DUF3223 domain-containing protein [Pantoea agglomerans]|uniref:DUF3223 domain-containing protein n=1 Tax=Enterobacter agglomerans TaxID=549 RepID=UPI001A8E839E|nr:DUF3223 domain-containing protein [Pantoea agglomerans]MBN9929004.1 DUF3223 domain-containing protein [Pantoea agglomerans]
MKYTVAGKSFLTKQLIKKEAQRILNKYTIGNTVKGEDYHFLLSLFKNHSEWEEKSRGGFKEIHTGKASHGTTCFYLKKEDDLEDISFIHAIKCLKPNK